MTDKFDYNYLGICQYDGDCGFPAVARGWWCKEDGQSSKEILLCISHLEFILETEANDKGFDKG